MAVPKAVIHGRRGLFSPDAAGDQSLDHQPLDNMSFLKEIKDAYKQTKQSMQQPQGNRDYAPPP